MDPLAHTLIGAALGETGLRRVAPRAALVLIVGANLPDVDALTVLLGADANLALRRGWTHGVLAMAVLPWLLVEAVLWRDRGRDPSPARATGASRRPLLALAYLAVLSHPALDWLNTYGVRLLMPFDGRWFYGDALFISDPWMWLLAGSSVVLARSASRRSVAWWLLLGLATTALVTAAPVPDAARLTWLAALAALALARRAAPGPRRVALLARATITILGVYVVAMALASRRAGEQATRWLAAQGVAVERVVVNPVPAAPLARSVVAAAPDAYHFVELDWLGGEPRRSAPALPRRVAGPVMEAALVHPDVAGMAGWLRLPSFEVAESAGGYRVVIRDLRYARDAESGFGVAVVELDRELRPILD